ncbi:MAG: membrane protease YdiL (CAAX protease family) [Kiritimatiellia bacterium]|jgi:membrane protease YdiL (CAAX protease family)
MVLYVLLVVVLGSLTGLATLSIELAAEDPEKWTRRCMMLWGAILLWPLLKVLKWPGMQETGWAIDPDGPGRGRLMGSGFITGAGMIILLFIAVWGGTRYWNLAYPPGKIAVKVFTYGISAFTVALIEETAMRGIIFRSLARSWNTLGAMILIGIVFATAHVLGPSAAALESGDALAVMRSAFTRMTREPDVAIRLLNLFMMNAVMCLLLLKTGNIWMGVGMHAAWVWVKRLNSILADSDETSPLRIWLGTRSDFTNAWICLVVLIGLAIWAYPRKGTLRVG